MSRIGRKPIIIPQGVTATVEGKLITVKGPKGSLDFTCHKDMTVDFKENELVVERPSDSKLHKSLHGTTRAVINIWLLV